MGVTRGYKQTEIGTIPVDWRVETVENISTVGRGRVISHKEIARSTNPRFPVYSSQTSGGGVMGYLDGYEFEGQFITWTTDGENAGTVFARDGRFNCTNVCGTIKLKSGNHLFVAAALGRVTSRHVSRHVGNPKLMNGVMKKVKVALPATKVEEDAIAQVLSDADALIESLEQLLAKKRQIKQGAMQELLTGKKRLPGFDAQWEETQLGAIAERIVGGGTPSRSVPTFWGGEIPWMTVKDFADHNPRGTLESITRDGLAHSASHLIPSGTLIASTRMAIGKAVMFDVDVAINQDLKAIFPTKDVSPQFLTWWFKKNERGMAELGSGSTVMGLSLHELRKISFSKPPLPEQTAIATVLADMETEIAALDARLTKARQLKQGMMQQLLTGRIRLV